MRQGDLVQFIGPPWHLKEYSGKYGIFEDWYCPTRGYANILWFFSGVNYPVADKYLKVVSRL